MRYEMLLVAALCVAGCASTLSMRSGGVQYDRSGLGEIDPVAVSTAGYIDARSDTERAWGEVLLTDPETALGFLRDMAHPWGYYGYGGYGYGGYGQRRPVGQTDPCYYGPPCGVDLAPVGGVR